MLSIGAFVAYAYRVAHCVRQEQTIVVTRRAHRGEAALSVTATRRLRSFVMLRSQRKLDDVVSDSP